VTADAGPAQRPGVKPEPQFAATARPWCSSAASRRWRCTRFSSPPRSKQQLARVLATVVFADIRGFTRLSETLSPEKVVEFLNDFLEEMTGAILDHKGMVRDRLNALNVELTTKALPPLSGRDPALRVQPLRLWSPDPPRATLPS
jgi:hypothetical protein